MTSAGPQIIQPMGGAMGGVMGGTMPGTMGGVMGGAPTGQLALYQPPNQYGYNQV